MKIRSMLILALAFFSLASMIAYGIYFNINSSGTAQTQYDGFMSTIANVTSGTLNSYIDSVSSSAAKVKYNAAITGFISDEKNMDAKAEALVAARTYVGDDTGISRIMILNSTANVLLNTDTNYENVIDAAFLAGIQAGSVYVNPIYENEKILDYEVLSRVDINDKSVLVFFNKSEISSILTSSMYPTNGRVVLVDSNHNILDSSYIGVAEEVGLPEYKIIKEVLANSSKLNTSLDFQIANTGRRAYMISAGNSGWYVAALGETGQALNHSGPANGSLAGTIIFIAFVMITAGIIIVVMITKPLSTIEETLLKVNRGDHDSRIEIMSRNEYGDIARAFNGLLDEIIVIERRYRTIVEMSDDIVFEWNFMTNEVFFSTNFNKKFSYRAPSDHYTDSFLLKGKVHPDDYERYRADLEHLAKGEEFKNKEYRWKNIYGDYIWCSLHTATIRDKDGQIVKIVGVITDIDRAKKSETLLLARASYDSLTGVYNRETIENIIDGEIEKLKPESEECAILFVDIDDFKIYNDKYSHATGDQVLKFTAETLQGAVKEFGFVGRYGGDEFVVCIRNGLTNSPSRISNDILQALKDGFVCDTNVHLSVNVSIGISVIKDNSKHVDEIIANADDAMYRIKKNGKSSYGFF